MRCYCSYFLWQLIAKNWKIRLAWHTALRTVYQRRQLLLRVVCLTMLLLANNNGAPVLRQSRRRFQAMLVSLPTCLKRLSGYLHPSTFIFPLGSICNAIEKDTITEEPIPREARLAISLYRLAIDDYYLTIAEMAGIEEQTVGYIVNEMTSAIVDCLWKIPLKEHMPIGNQKKNLEAKSKVWRTRRNSLAVGKRSKGVIDQFSAPVVDWSHAKNIITFLFRGVNGYGWLQV